MRFPSDPQRWMFTLSVLALACTQADISPKVGGGGNDAAAGDGGMGLVGGSSMDAAAAPDAPAQMTVDSAAPDALSLIDTAPLDTAPLAGIRPDATGQLVITELLADADAAADDFGEWFEVYNPSATQAYDLFDCYLGDIGGNTHQIKAHVVIGPGKVATFGLFSLASEGGFVPTYTYTGVKFSNDSNDGARLTCGAAVIDEFRYQASAIVSGRAFSLDPMHFNAVDNDTASNWCIADKAYNAKNGAVDYGTPGAVNPPCP